MKTQKHPWWKGLHGEWYVVCQAVLIVLVVFGPQTAFSLPPWPEAIVAISPYAGGLFIAAGFVMSIFAALQLGSNLTPLPHPKKNSTLVITGPYRLVRHPIYCGIILAAIGWGLFVQGWLTLVYAATLVLFFDIKSRREEFWLARRFPNYVEYQEHVKKLIPFIY